MKTTFNVFMSMIVLSMAVGCGHQDFGGVITGPLSKHAGRDATSPEDRFREYDELERSRRLAKVLGQWKGATDGSQEYHIGVGDSLEFGIMALEEPGRVTKLLRVVDENGEVELQWIGAVAALGKTASQVRKHVTKEFDGRFLRDPQITVRVAEHRSAPVVVTGAVGKPGIYYLSRDRRTILEMLAEADGLGKGAGDEILLIRGGTARMPDDVDDGVAKQIARTGELITVDLRELLDEGDLRLNYWVESGDMISVPPRAREYVYVLGYVARPGALEMDSSEPLQAMQAVAMVGGPTTTARPQNSCILRETSAGQKLIPVDLMAISRGKSPKMVLKTGDTLVVGTSFFGRLQEFIRPTVGLGASYAPGM